MLGHELGPRQRVEGLVVERFIAKLAVDRFDVTVFARADRLNVSRLGPNRGDPFTPRRGDELRPIVRPGMSRYTIYSVELSPFQ